MGLDERKHTHVLCRPDKCGSVFRFYPWVCNACNRGVTGFSIALSKANWPVLSHLASVVSAFFFGSIICGIIIRDSHLKIGRRYGIALMLEGLLLCMSAVGFQSNSMLGEIIASLACGLQNAMVSMYSGAIVRTTHMTGIVTDLGTLIGRRIGNTKFDYHAAYLYSLLLVSFIIGGSIGVFVFQAINYFALLVPAFITGVTGFLYFILRHYKLSKVSSS